MGYAVQIEKLIKSFGGKKIINGIDLAIKQKSITAILGESGSGKTTLSRLIAGLETPDQGIIKIEGKTVVDTTHFLNPEKRGVGMVFQDYALFPHLTVSQNITYGLKRGESNKKYLDELLDLVQLTGHEQKFPHQLSGGQRQRVALARALAPKPKLLILDEPFSNLDNFLKQRLRSEVFDIISKTGITAIFITHDTQDALFIADDIIILENGRLAQQGLPANIYKKPSSYYIGSLFGTVILLDESDLACFGFIVQEPMQYAIREEDIGLCDKNSAYTSTVNVIRSTFFGNCFLNTVYLPNGKKINFNSDKGLVGEVVIGFSGDSLLGFTEVSEQ